jgi:hypothetical protein
MITAHNSSMTFTTTRIIRELWDAQGYGNLALWNDSTSSIIPPGEPPQKDGNPPLLVLKPLPLVGGYPMLDHALGDPALHEVVESRVLQAGGVIIQDQE